MKTNKKISLLFVLFFLYVYIVSINNIPSSITIFKGEEVKLSTLWGIKINKKEDILKTSTLVEEDIFKNKQQEQLTVSLFNKIDLKTIDVNIMEEIEVIPSGQNIGIKLYTSGILVVGTSNIEGKDGNNYKPFENADIKEGDIIKEINGNIINNTEELINAINSSNGQEMEITYISNKEEKKCKITPIKNKENNYKIGLWVRDSAAGIGTLTFYYEETESFAALGHAITDIDTGDILDISSGEITDINIVSIKKGLPDNPGKIQATLDNNKIIGNIYKNTEFGIFGIVKNIDNLEIDYSNKMKVASRNEIQLGEAKILSQIDGKIKEYNIEIEKKYLNNNYDNKSMLIKITDEELLNKTGGIIQGMSGSPIIQNGKFIGAVTHVFVNNPEKGYAVFADMMF